jgi:hypothetical protein
MDDLNEVLSRYKDRSEGGKVRRRYDHVSKPKSSGYRSVHLVVEFLENGAGRKHAGCNVEIQLRTQLQHVWATTVEAVGSMRNEDLKAGKGCREWLRFLSLMSGHLAELESQPKGPHLPMSSKDLRDEARDLASRLSVRENLTAFSALMHEVETHGGHRGSRYMLKMDTQSGNIQVSPVWREMFTFDDLDDDFQELRQSLEVTVDNMAALKQAYPNYFADTKQFLEVLEELSSVKRSAAKSSIDNLDLSFLRSKSVVLPEAKVIHLEYTGIVYWGNEKVGRWEKGFYGEHYFMPNNENYYAFQSRNLAYFKDDLSVWLEGL